MADLIFANHALDRRVLEPLLPRSVFLADGSAVAIKSGSAIGYRMLYF